VSLEAELASWAATRPGWQQDVLALLCRQEPFDDATIAVLADRLIANEHPEAEIAGLAAGDIPGSPITSAGVQLVALNGLTGVNALAPDQTLTFGPSGLTVVYGDNASGKSGYARVLKSAAGARVRDDILTDVFASTEPLEQHALVVYKIGADTGDQEWKWPGAPSTELRQVRFFDEACGDAYLSADSEVTYRPSALVLLDQLIAVCDAVRAVLEQRLRETDSVRQALPSVPNGTHAARFVAGLKANMSADDIDARCQAPADAAELGELLSEEARLKTSDPTKEQARLAAMADGLDAAAKYMDRLATTFSTEGMGRLAKLRTRAAELRAAATVASSQDFNAEPLSGVGGATWRALWEAARAFSETEAFNDHLFPVTAAGGRCVLCQQELSADAAGRLERFRGFMSDTTERDAAQAEHALASSRESLAAFSQTPPAVVAAVAKLGTADAALAESADAWTTDASKRCAAVMAWLDGTEDEQPAALDAGPGKTLARRSQMLKDRATTIDASSFAKDLESTGTRIAELQGKITLCASKDAIIQEVARLLIRTRIEAAKRMTDTGTITRKSSELAREHVTRQVRDQFTRESERLRLRRITLDDIGGVKGQLLHRPALLGAATRAPIKKILSEGEQTALGLSGFFTEVAFDDTQSAVVLDDPVTSLDHERRKYVARRLAEVAGDRQVVVFTHDLTFVGELAKAADLAGTKVTERTIERRPDGIPGVCVDIHPWKARDVAARLNHCETELARIKRGCATWSSEDYERVSADWAGKLSETLERIISLEIVSYVVDRARGEVRPKMVRLLARVTEEDDREYQDVYGQCSQWARRHDKNPEVNYVPPALEEMQTALARVQGLFDRVKKYRK